MTLDQLNPKLTAFKEWLKAHGVEIMTPTNEWEVLRFRCNTSTSIIYKDAKGKLNLQGRASEALNAFNKNWTWSAGVKKHRGKGKRGQFVAALIERDGRGCFYCGKEMLHDETTIEHLLALSQGGVDRLANMALSCDEHNRMAGHLSLVEKIKLRDRIRSDYAKHA